MKSVWGKVYPFLPAGVWYAVIFWFSAQTGHSSGSMSDRLALLFSPECGEASRCF